VAEVRLLGPAHGYATPPPQQTLVVPGDTTENVDFELFVGGEVSGVVKRRDGKYLTREYRVRLEGADLPPRSTTVRSGQSFKLEHVYPGTYDILLQTGGQTLAQRKAVIIGERQTLRDIDFVVEE
jgi:hypothetical protein